jgi:hypothetical protein
MFPMDAGGHAVSTVPGRSPSVKDTLGPSTTSLGGSSWPSKCPI